MTDAIFLSAGVPDPRRGPEYAKTADSVAIAAAVSALAYVSLGRRHLVWGGQPAITPMIAVAARDLEVDFGSWVHLYQSHFFDDVLPDENRLFKNVTYTSAVVGSPEGSTRLLRQRMLADFRFTAAVFIGGMAGVIEEFELIRALQPEAKVIPVLSTGGAALSIADRMRALDRDLLEDLDYVALFHRHLDISLRERRYARPEEQPLTTGERYWRPGAG